MLEDSWTFKDFPLPANANEALVLIAKAEDILRSLSIERLALPAEEATRIACYRNADDKRARYAAHGLLRHCLGNLLARAPEDVHFIRDDKGRPFLAEAQGLDFNLSHGGRWIAVGISRGGRVGVDVQDGLEAFDWKAVSRAYLDASEIEMISILPPSKQTAAALELWCLKEAFLKATGEGLATPPHQLRPQRFEDGWRLTHQGYELKAGACFLADGTCAAWTCEAAAMPRVIRL
jgi:4'-phosphopantetheinyl transferase